MKYSFARLVFLTAVLLLGPAVGARARTYDLSWNVIAGGGGTSAGGSYSLSGTIGQPATGVLSGGSYTLDGGFWAIYAAVQTPGSPLLTITSSGPNVVLSWPASSAGFVLQENPVVNSTNWNAVSQGTNTANGTNSVTIPVAQGKLFFRLVYP